jgi:hypothetical protein
MHGQAGFGRFCIAGLRAHLQNARGMTGYAQPNAFEFERLDRELMELNPSAARSLEEGTVHGRFFSLRAASWRRGLRASIRARESRRQRQACSSDAILQLRFAISERAANQGRPVDSIRQCVVRTSATGRISDIGPSLHRNGYQIAPAVPSPPLFRRSAGRPRDRAERNGLPEGCQRMFAAKK